MPDPMIALGFFLVFFLIVVVLGNDDSKTDTDLR